MSKAKRFNMPVQRELTSIETEFVDQLEGEYKILQDKIDKIGAFRFTIKGGRSRLSWQLHLPVLPLARFPLGCG